MFRNKVVVHRNWLKTRPAFLELERIDCKNKGVNVMKRRPRNLKNTILIWLNQDCVIQSCGEYKSWLAILIFYSIIDLIVTSAESWFNAEQWYQSMATHSYAQFTVLYIYIVAEVSGLIT